MSYSWIALALAAGGEHPFAFRDVSLEAGLLPHVSGMRGHSAAWGDVDGDGWVDLYVGSFFEEGSKANVLLPHQKGKIARTGLRANQRVTVRP